MDDSDCQIIETVDSADSSVILLNDSPDSSTKNPSSAEKGSPLESHERTRPSLVPQRLDMKFQPNARSGKNTREQPQISMNKPGRLEKKSSRRRKKEKKLKNVVRHLSMEGLSLIDGGDRGGREQQTTTGRPRSYNGFSSRERSGFGGSRNQGHAKGRFEYQNFTISKKNETVSSRNTPQPLQSLMTLSNVVVSTSKRFIVIDGSNVAVTHGIDTTQKKVFSCLGIKLTVEYFLNRGHTQIKALVPRFRRGCSDHQCPTLNPEILDELDAKGFLTYTPSRFVDNRLVLPYDDRFILKTALHYNAVIVSNDNYRDLWSEDQRWKKLIETNLLQYSFVNDLFLIADDPFGRGGPTIDQFLSTDYLNNNKY